MSILQHHLGGRGEAFPGAMRHALEAADPAPHLDADPTEGETPTRIYLLRRSTPEEIAIDEGEGSAREEPSRVIEFDRWRAAIRYEWLAREEEGGSGGRRAPAPLSYVRYEQRQNRRETSLYQIYPQLRLV